MQQIYQKIWELAKPYYEKGRPMDIVHIEWFMEIATMVCDKEKLDDTILLPLVILHDVGYSRVKDVAEKNYYQLDIRRFHMDEGKKITEEILRAVAYPEEKIKIIADYVGVHDNWAFGEVDRFTNNPILGTFKDLDYLWIYTGKGSKAIQENMRKSDREMLKFLKSEPSPIYGKKPFSNETTKQLHKELLTERELELGNGSVDSS
ncbi:TPA: hypothetical protein DIV55_04800 [Patescibacteria group bacterium]|uniref:HD domain-containing protein n=1 Tax=Candidatus Gottesmanbacteria bacterium GW2011_GWA1_43_11 TaxID=1618436 RepID=A0A0G1CDS4_9BACT|nr:MAG: hypothetical protein UV59_C0031G0002 [Candidatus Gottesmanbacteria bacterium GW2011_GWA1_43_11]HCS79030.1 hypothetical protein [Patescibacteria group bacterium]